MCRLYDEYYSVSSFFKHIFNVHHLTKECVFYATPKSVRMVNCEPIPKIIRKKNVQRLVHLGAVLKLKAI